VKQRATIACAIAKRRFLIDDNHFTYYPEKDKEGVPNVALKKYKIVGASVLIEKQPRRDENNQEQQGSDVDPTRMRWLDYDKMYRIEMRFKDREAKPIYYYCDDLNELKALAVKIKIASESGI
jgi:hypothetical protein